MFFFYSLLLRRPKLKQSTLGDRKDRPTQHPLAQKKMSAKIKNSLKKFKNKLLKLSEHF